MDNAQAYSEIFQNILSEIDKQTAAMEQLETAIKLFFEDRDPISCYTLSTSAKQITEDLLRAGKLATARDPSKDDDWYQSFDETTLAIVKPEFRKKVRDILREPQNYLKHADKDHDKILDAGFIELCPFMIMGAVHNILRLGWETPSSFRIFNSYMIRYHADLFSFPEQTRKELDKILSTMTYPDDTETKRMLYQLLKKTSSYLFIEEDIYK